MKNSRRKWKIMGEKMKDTVRKKGEILNKMEDNGIKMEDNGRKKEG